MMLSKFQQSMAPFFLSVTSMIGLAVWMVPANDPLQEPQQEFKNLVENPGFESISTDQPAEWEPQTWNGAPRFELVKGEAHTGRNCVKITSSEGANASWSQRIRVKPNTKYRVSAWVRTDSVTDRGLGVLINLHELQMEGKTESLYGTNQWTQISSQFNSGRHRTLLLNLLFGGWGRSTGTAWFDDVELVEIDDRPDPPKMTQDEAAKLFETKVLPVFKEHCFECHGGGDKIRAEFVLTNREDLIAGGESGEAIDLESPLDSLLLDAINYQSYEMPPSGKLPDDVIEDITKWVQMGAPWSGEEFKPETEMAEHGPPTVNEETKKWWSYQQPVRHTPPESDVAGGNEIDRFLLARLAAAGLQPNPPASKRTLIRRAYYDLIGLPPTPEEVQEFVQNEDPEAFSKLVDQLLDSKHYGEKWGRHWLDLVRYAESNSYERDGPKPYVWRYRDYVIRSFNDNKPYDQFLMEQLAGDELEGDFNADHIIATGYYRLGRWDDEPADPELAWYDDADDILATTCQTMLGMTVNCSRCHDHKIDPIPQEDYYRMLAFLRNIRRYGVRAHETVLAQSTRPIVPPDVQNVHDQAVKEHNREVRKNSRQLKEIEQWVTKDFIPVEHEDFKYDMNRVALIKKRIGQEIDGKVFTRETAEQYEALFKEMRRLRREKPKRLAAALCITEKDDTAPETYVLIRGNVGARGDQVEPGFPAVLSPPEPEIVPPAHRQSTGRRLAMAKWIANPDNPLTARVMANRIWQYHFGRGIVRSANDFGFQGTAPTHPLLLDWLAVEFVDSGWDIKHMHRLMMNSLAYQMASTPNPDAYDVDPTNNLFWRYNMRRLTAEEIRDSILAVNGSLNKTSMYGPSIYPTIPQEVLDGQSRPGENWHTSKEEEQNRRSVYIHIKRSLPVPLLASFDVNDPDTTCPVRFNTVQPTQALGMINSEFINQQAERFANRIREVAGNDLAAQVATALELVMQRRPRPDEIDRGVRFVKTQQDSGQKPAKALQLFCVVAYNLNEFIYLD